MKGNKTRRIALIPRRLMMERTRRRKRISSYGVYASRPYPLRLRARHWYLRYRVRTMTGVG